MHKGQSDILQNASDMHGRQYCDSHTGGFAVVDTFES